MPSNNSVKNKLRIKVNRKGEFVSIEIGGANMLIEPEEAIDIAEKLTAQADKILKSTAK